MKCMFCNEEITDGGGTISAYYEDGHTEIVTAHTECIKKYIIKYKFNIPIFENSEAFIRFCREKPDISKVLKRILFFDGLIN